MIRKASDLLLSHPEPCEGPKEKDVHSLSALILRAAQDDRRRVFLPSRSRTLGHFDPVPNERMNDDLLARRDSAIIQAAQSVAQVEANWFAVCRDEVTAAISLFLAPVLARRERLRTALTGAA